MNPLKPADPSARTRLWRTILVGMAVTGLTTLLLFGATCLRAQEQTSTPGVTLGKVNGQVLTKLMDDEFSQEVSLFSGDLLGENKPRINLIETTLLAQEAARQGLDQSPRFKQRWAAARRLLAVGAFRRGLRAHATEEARRTYDASAIVHDPSRYLIHLEAIVAPSQEEAGREYASLQSGTSFEKMAEGLAAGAKPHPDLHFCPGGGNQCNQDPYFCPGGAPCNFWLPFPNEHGDIGFGWPDRSSKASEGVPVLDTTTLDFGRFFTWPKEVTEAVRDLPVGQTAKPIAIYGKWVILRVIERRPPSFEEASRSLIRQVTGDTEFNLENGLLKAAKIELATPKAPDYVFATINGEPITAFDYLDYTNDQFNDLYVDQEIPDKLTLERGAEFGRWLLGQAIANDSLGGAYDDMQLLRPFLVTQLMTRDNLWGEPQLQEELALWRMVLLGVELRDTLTQRLVDSGQYRTVEYAGTLARIVAAETPERATALAEALRAGTPVEQLPQPFKGCALYGSSGGKGGYAAPHDCDSRRGLAIWYAADEDAPIVQAAKNLAIGGMTTPVKTDDGYAVALILDRSTTREGAPTDDATNTGIGNGTVTRDDSPWRLIRDAVNREVHDVMLPRLKAQAKIEMAAQ